MKQKLEDVTSNPDSDFQNTHEKHWSQLTENERKQTINDAYLMTTEHKYVTEHDATKLKSESKLAIHAVQETNIQRELNEALEALHRQRTVGKVSKRAK